MAFSSYYSASALANLLHLYASQGLQLGPQAAAAAAARALAVLQQEQQAVQARWEGPAAARAGGLPPLGFSLAALSKLMWAVAALGLSHPPLLESLLPALSAALAGEGEAARAGGGQPGGALVRQLARLAAALGQLLATGQLAAARLDSVPALEPLWRQLQELLECSAARAAQAGGPGAGLQLQDARAVQHAADALNHGLGRWGGGSPFQVAPCVQRCLG